MVMDRAAAAMLIESCLLTVCGGEEESVACTVKVKVPEALGVPLIAPVEEFRLSPVGIAPTVMLQLYGVVPPDAASVAL